MFVFGLPLSEQFFPFCRSRHPVNGGMAKRHRDLSSSDLFHVINRGVDGQDIFSLDADWFDFEQIMLDRFERSGAVLRAYALMTNHFHWLVERKGADLSKTVGGIESIHAQRYNRRTQRRGPLFDPRYWCEPVVGEAHAAVAVRYIHRNPIDIVGGRALHTYRFSSLPQYLCSGHGNQNATPLRSSTGLEPGHHLDFVLTRHPADRRPTAWLPPPRPITLDQLIETINRAAGEPRTPTGGKSRVLAMSMAIEFRVATTLELADRFGVAPSSLRAIARRGRVLTDTDPAVARLKARTLQLID
jgi:REP element-mobilizing transposase RayT